MADVAGVGITRRLRVFLKQHAVRGRYAATLRVHVISLRSLAHDVAREAGASARGCQRAVESFTKDDRLTSQ